MNSLLAFLESLADPSSAFRGLCEPDWGMPYAELEPLFRRWSQTSMAELEAFRFALQGLYPRRKTGDKLLFIGAATVPITPIPEIIAAELLGYQLEVQVHRNFGLEAYLALFPKLHFAHLDAHYRVFPESYDEVLVHGSDQTIDHFAALAQSAAKRFSGFGHKISFACLETSESVSIPALLSDLRLFGGRGCLSPQALLLGAASEGELAVFLKTLNQGLSQSFPLTASLQLWLEQKTPANPPNYSRLQVSKSQLFRGAAPLGALEVLVYSKQSELKSLFERFEGRVAALGMNSPTQASWRELVGAETRIIPLGQMQTPELTWLQKPTLYL